MSDSTPENVGFAVISAQNAIHTVKEGWALSSALAEFGFIMERWAQHPKGRNWNLIGDLDKFVKEIESKNKSCCNF